MGTVADGGNGLKGQASVRRARAEAGRRERLVARQKRALATACMDLDDDDSACATTEEEEGFPAGIGLRWTEAGQEFSVQTASPPPQLDKHPSLCGVQRKVEGCSSSSRGPKRLECRRMRKGFWPAAAGRCRWKPESIRGGGSKGSTRRGERAEERRKRGGGRERDGQRQVLAWQEHQVVVRQVPTGGRKLLAYLGRRAILCKDGSYRGSSQEWWREFGRTRANDTQNLKERKWDWRRALRFNQRRFIVHKHDLTLLEAHVLCVHQICTWFTMTGHEAEYNAISLSRRATAEMKESPKRRDSLLSRKLDPASIPPPRHLDAAAQARWSSGKPTSNMATDMQTDGPSLGEGVPSASAVAFGATGARDAYNQQSQCDDDETMNRRRHHHRLLLFLPVHHHHHDASSPSPPPVKARFAWPVVTAEIRLC
ncbi:hypothetical protein HRG_012885 [Hirsutella rhossiliensis]